MKRLTNEEILKCLKLYSEKKDEKAIILLIECNQGLVHYFVKKHLNRGLSYEELLSAGNEGLFQAIKRYDYNKGIEGFASYISKYIEGYILNEFKNYDKHKHVLSFEQPVFEGKDGDELKLEDVIGTDDEIILDDIFKEMKIEVVKNALSSLTSTERKIVLLKYGLKNSDKITIEEISKILNCSVQTVKNKEHKALIKMRHPKITKKIKDFID